MSSRGASGEALLCNPQVHVHPGDYRDLYEGFPQVRQRLAEASEALGADLAADFYSDDPDRINRGTVVRPASLALAVAIHDLARPHDPPPDFIAGLSLGQITAAHLAGCMSFRDAVRMVHTMATIEDEEFGDSGLGVAFYYNVDLDGLRGTLERMSAQARYLRPCAYTADDQMIATGDFDSLERLNVAALEHGGLGVMIPYGPPAHSPIMEPVERRFAAEWEYLDGLADPRAPLVCNHSSEFLRTSEEVHHALVTQYTQTVHWDRGLRRLPEAGVTSATIIGPGHFVNKSLQFTSVQFEVRAHLTADDLRETVRS